MEPEPKYVEWVSDLVTEIASSDAAYEHWYQLGIDRIMEYEPIRHLRLPMQAVEMQSRSGETHLLTFAQFSSIMDIVRRVRKDLLLKNRGEANAGDSSHDIESEPNDQ